MSHSHNFFAVNVNDVAVFVNVNADFSDHFFIHRDSAFFDKFVGFSARAYSAFCKVFVDTHIFAPNARKGGVRKFSIKNYT